MRRGHGPKRDPVTFLENSIRELEKSLHCPAGPAIGHCDFTWLPLWLRSRRVGDVFTAYQSSNGIEWFEVGKSTVALPRPDEKQRIRPKVFSTTS